MAWSVLCFSSPTFYSYEACCFPVLKTGTKDRSWLNLFVSSCVEPKLLRQRRKEAKALEKKSQPMEYSVMLRADFQLATAWACSSVLGYSIASARALPCHDLMLHSQLTPPLVFSYSVLLSLFCHTGSRTFTDSSVDAAVTALPGPADRTPRQRVAHGQVGALKHGSIGQLLVRGLSLGSLAAGKILWSACLLCPSPGFRGRHLLGRLYACHS